MNYSKDKQLKKNSTHAFFFFCFLMTVPFYSFAQSNTTIDSLKSVLPFMAEDGNKVKALIKLGDEFNQIHHPNDALPYLKEALLLAEKIKDSSSIIKLYISMGVSEIDLNNYTEAESFLNQALQLAESKKDQIGISHAYYYLGAISRNRGDDQKALDYFEKSLAVSQSISDSKNIFNSTLSIGHVYLSKADYQQATKYYNTCKQIAENSGDQKDRAFVYSAIGYMNDYQGNFENAYENYFAALKIYEILGMPHSVGEMNNCIGSLLYYQHNPREALQYFLAAKKIFEETGDKLWAAHTMANMGNVYADEENYAEALDLMIQALDIYKEIGRKREIAQSQMNIGTIYNDQDEYEKALPYLQESIILNEEMGNKRDLGYGYINLGVTSYNLDRYDDATTAYHQALKIFTEMQNKSLLPIIYSGLIDVDTAQGNYKLAFEHQSLFKAVSDSLENESNSQIMTEIRSKYESEKKDKEILKLENEKQLSGLQIRMQQESFQRMQLEKNNLATLNLFNQQHIELLDKEKAIRQFELDMKNSELAKAKATTEAQSSTLALMQKEAEIQMLKLNKKSAFKSYLLGGLLLLGILGIFIYSNYIAREKLKLQTLRVKIASDLHDDVGSTLSSISIFSEMAQKQSREVIPLLNTIGESSRKMLDAMADIVWSINPENDQFDNLLLRMRSFAYQLLGSKKIQFEFEADDILSRRKLSMEIRKNLYLIFKEAANNMAKYSEANKAYFSIREENNTLVMLICDNGKGFDSQAPSPGNGLKNMKRRAAEMGGQLLIDSTPENGTSIHLRVAI